MSSPKNVNFCEELLDVTSCGYENSAEGMELLAHDDRQPVLGNEFQEMIVRMVIERGVRRCTSEPIVLQTVLKNFLVSRVYKNVSQPPANVSEFASCVYHPEVQTFLRLHNTKLREIWCRIAPRKALVQFISVLHGIDTVLKETRADHTTDPSKKFVLEKLLLVMLGYPVPEISLTLSSGPASDTNESSPKPDAPQDEPSVDGAPDEPTTESAQTPTTEIVETRPEFPFHPSLLEVVVDFQYFTELFFRVVLSELWKTIYSENQPNQDSSNQDTNGEDRVDDGAGPEPEPEPEKVVDSESVLVGSAEAATTTPSPSDGETGAQVNEAQEIPVQESESEPTAMHELLIHRLQQVL